MAVRIRDLNPAVSWINDPYSKLKQKKKSSGPGIHNHIVKKERIITDPA
jgi:hypothetical protein